MLRFSRLDHWLRKLDSALFGNVLVLMYHRVYDFTIDPFSISVSPHVFQQHLQMLQTMGEVVPAKSIMRFSKRRLGQGLKFVLTFDDGYRDNFEVALPMLEKEGLPATFFITENNVSDVPAYYWDVLQSVFLETESLPQSFQCCLSGESISVQLGEDAHYPLHRRVQHQDWRLGRSEFPTRRHYWLKYFTYALKDSSQAERSQFLVSLTDPTGTASLLKGGALAHWDTIRETAQKQDYEIGSHSLTHRRLSKLPLSEQEYEINESKVRIERNIGRPVTSFAIPHGGPDDYSPETVACIKNAGYLQSYIVCQRALHHHDDSFRIPRLHIGNWNGAEFQLALSKALLKF